MGLTSQGSLWPLPYPSDKCQKHAKRADMEAEKRAHLSETAQHQFQIISIPKQPREQLADSWPGYLPQCISAPARHPRACQLLRAPNVTLALFPKRREALVVFGSPLVLPSQKQHASTTSIWKLFTAGEAQAETTGHLASHPSGTPWGRVPQEQRVPQRQDSPKGSSSSTSCCPNALHLACSAPKAG